MFYTEFVDAVCLSFTSIQNLLYVAPVILCDCHQTKCRVWISHVHHVIIIIVHSPKDFFKEVA